MAKHGRRQSIGMRGVTATCVGTAALALLPAPGGAAIVSYGSDLALPATNSQARPVDTAYWQSTFADARAIVIASVPFATPTACRAPQ